MNKSTQMIGNMNEAKNVEKYLRKKNMPKRIYIIAAKKSEFVQWCGERGIHTASPTITWVNEPGKLQGFTIMPNDEIAWVHRQSFDEEDLIMIENEINMRAIKE